MFTEDKVTDFFLLLMIFEHFMIPRWKNIRLKLIISTNITVAAVCQKQHKGRNDFCIR